MGKKRRKKKERNEERNGGEDLKNYSQFLLRYAELSKTVSTDTARHRPW